MGVGDEVLLPSDSDHTSINRFGMYERQRFQPIGDAIKELLQAATGQLKETVDGR